jgi:hypothetical protein
MTNTEIKKGSYVRIMADSNLWYEIRKPFDQLDVI